MDLNFTPTEQAFREEARGFTREQLRRRHQPKNQERAGHYRGRVHALAERFFTRKAGRPRLAHRVRRHGLDAGAAAHLRRRVRRRGRAAAAALRREHGRARSSWRSGAPRSSSGSCRASSRSTTGGARAIPSRARARTSPRSRPAPSARRPLHRQRPEDLDHARRSTPTGSSACAHRHRGPPQEGISFLLIDMKTPGVTVRPIRMLDGETRSTRCGSRT